MKLLPLVAGIIGLASCTQVKQVDGNSRAEVLAEDKISFVNFYADWCRFSRQLHPIFDAASEALKDESGIVFGRVDCDKESAICKEYQVNKYPTIRLFRHGKVLKKEYRGTRSVEAMKAFLLEQIRDPVTKVATLEELSKVTEPANRIKS
jgi:endoplasmic reticulum resident protein 44